MAATDRRFLITVDDPGGLIQDLGLFTAARRFFDAEGVPASFMVVPRGLDDFELDRQPTWLEALHGALSDGHDCQLHGLDHRDCEFGPYPAMIAALHGPDSAEEMERDRQRFGHGWNAGVYREKLDLALGIYERAFSRRPVVFRTGALSQTPDLYETMADAGLRYTSNHVADPRGWKYIVEGVRRPGGLGPGGAAGRALPHRPDREPADHQRVRLVPDRGEDPAAPGPGAGRPRAGSTTSGGCTSSSVMCSASGRTTGCRDACSTSCSRSPGRSTG